uniref:Uncharacterized protein n=1 Tax=Heterorhabditis bacteriophora TaxID=37862 RepID=A0A1I7XD43_HETBA
MTSEIDRKMTKIANLKQRKNSMSLQ